ncbi:MAG: FAD:protein FMN transferase [Pseudomonadota bacterium]
MVLTIRCLPLRLKIKQHLVLFLFVLNFFFIGSVHAQWYSETRPIMGTEISVSIFKESTSVNQNQIEKKLKKAANIVFEEINRLNESLSPYIKSSDLTKINEFATQSPIKINNEIKFIIEKSLNYSEISQGAFDITYASVGYLYHYREKVHPSQNQIDSHLSGINFQNIQLKNNTIYFENKNTKIDLGGIAKGYAVDQGIKLLKKQNIKIAHVMAGGDSYYLGSHIDRPWIVGIKHPRDAYKIALKIPVEDIAVSTSGDYERYFVKDGKRYHHIIQPKTGKPSTSGVVSVTVLGPSSIDADALSTTLFVLGVKEGLNLIKTLPNYDAIFIDDNGKIHYSTGLISPE